MGITARSIASAAVLTACVVIWIHEIGGKERRGFSSFTLACAIGLVALGGFAMAWNFHMVVTTGDAEAPQFLIAVALTVQGALTIFHLWRGAACAPEQSISLKI